jgi:Tfp pilus assembly protein PilE
LGNKNQNKGLGVVDTLLVCTLVGILITVSFYYYQRVVLEARRVALKAELQSIRTAINAYRALHNNRNPESLKALITEKYIVPKDEKDPMEQKYLKQARLFERHYLEVYTLDKEGYPIDPFGNRFRYDPKTGEAASGTEGYELW